MAAAVAWQLVRPVHGQPCREIDSIPAIQAAAIHCLGQRRYMLTLSLHGCLSDGGSTRACCRTYLKPGHVPVRACFPAPTLVTEDIKIALCQLSGCTTIESCWQGDEWHRLQQVWARCCRCRCTRSQPAACARSSHQDAQRLISRSGARWPHASLLQGPIWASKEPQGKPLDVHKENCHCKQVRCSS